MNAIAKPLALLALLATIVPPMLFMFSGVSKGADGTEAETVAADDQVHVDEDADSSAVAGESAADSNDDGMMTQGRMQNIMLVGAILWFIAAPAWLKEND
jgi:hypothetical protein